MKNVILQAIICVLCLGLSKAVTGNLPGWEFFIGACTGLAVMATQAIFEILHHTPANTHS